MFESKKNNVWFNIGNSLTASTSSTLLTILGGKETLFGADFGLLDITKHFKLTLTKFVGGVASISEVIKVTAKSGNALTIVRAYEPCPLNANATVMTQAPQVFDVGDFAYMNMTASDLIELGVLIDTLIDTKQNNCVMVTKSANYTFIGNEANNTGFSTNTTSGNITYTLNPALFPNTNGMYEFTICKSTNDVNTVIIDVGAGKTIDTAQTYTLTNFMETVIIRIASSTFVKVIAATNRNVVVAAIPTTQSIFIAGEDITAGNALYILPADGKVYKTDTSNSSKINFIGFATNTATTGNNVIVDTSGVSATQSGLTVGSDYYLSSISYIKNLLSSNINNGIIDKIIDLGGGKVFTLFTNSSGGASGIVSSYTNTSITNGTAVVISDDYNCKCTLINTNTIAVVYNKSSGQKFTNKITISGLVISLGTELQLSSSSSVAVAIGISKLGTNVNKAIISYADGSNSTSGKLCIVDYSSTTPVKGTVYQITHSYRMDSFNLITLNNTTFILSFTENNNNANFLFAGTFTSTTLTLGGSTSIGTSYGNNPVFKLNDNVFILKNGYTNSIIPYSVSGTTITAGTGFTSSVGFFIAKDSSTFYGIYGQSANTNQIKIFNYSGTTISSETAYKQISGLDIINNCYGIIDVNGTFIVTFDNSSTINITNCNTNPNISTTPGTNVRRIGKSVSTTAIELETSANDSLDGTSSTTATTGAVVLGNAVGYITVKINGVDRKIPYYNI